MLIGSMSLTSAFAALSLVYQAYAKVKNNKERCRQLVERCQLLVDRLQGVLQANKDTILLNRVKDLECAFKMTADTIMRVGQQGYIISLLRTEENAAAIIDCQQALTELVSFLNLEQTIDVSTWQKESEAAHKKDNAALLALGRKLEEGHDAILLELSQQGSTLAELSLVVQSISAGLTPAPSVDSTTIPGRTKDTAAPRKPSKYLVSSSSSVVKNRRSQSRKSSKSSTSPASSIASRRKQRKPIDIGQTQRISSAIQTDDLPIQSHQADRECEPEDSNSPPPAYTSINIYTENEQTATRVEPDSKALSDSANLPPSTPARGAHASVSRPRNVNTRFNKPLPRKPKENSRERPKNLAIERLPTSTAESHAMQGSNDLAFLVELRMLPENTILSKCIPLDMFVPIGRDNIALVQERMASISERLRPLLKNTESTLIYKHILMLCPPNTRPKLFAMRMRQADKQRTVRAYIMKSSDAMIIVSVKWSDKKKWILIPYTPEMRIKDVKGHVQALASNVEITECRLLGSTCELENETPLAAFGIKPYEYKMSMRVESHK